MLLDVLRSGLLPVLVRAELSAGVLAVVMILGSAEGRCADRVQFNRDIRPILSDRCFKCHGPAEAGREAGLRLDEPASATSELDSGARAVIPGKPDQSELLVRVLSRDDALRMPPPEAGKALTPAEIELLRQWIEQGAEWQGHWAFEPPRRPRLPAVADPAGTLSPIDRFVRRRLQNAGLEPSAQADRRTLVRRVTLDLTGLPPTPGEVDQFLEDEQPGAYERLVDRLLASPRYGEHMARYWLDAARYGDTHGLHLDNYREMWPYRDWVIRAFNRNLPFDQFTVEQLAGDLLPEPTTDQLIASGFNRCNVTTNEGGSINDEVYVRNVVDRVETTSTVFMGLTAGCAVCHNHKFDPLTMRDFYSMFAFFNSLDGNAMDGNRKDPAPVIQVPTQQQLMQAEELTLKRNELQHRLAARRSEAEPLFVAWLEMVRREGAFDVSRIPDLVASWQFDAPQQPVASADGKFLGRIEGQVDRVGGKSEQGIRFSQGGYVEVGDVGRFERTDKFSYGCWLTTPGNINGTPIARMDDGNGHRGWDLYVAGRRVAMHLIHQWDGNALKVTTAEDVLQPNQWHHVFVTYDGSSKAAGIRIYIDGQLKTHQVNVEQLTGTTVTETPLRFGRRNPGSPFDGGQIDDVRIYARTLTAAEVRVLSGIQGIGQILAIAPERRTEDQLRTLRNYFFNDVDERSQELERLLADVERRQKALESSYPTSLVFRETANPRPAFVLLRGQYDLQGEQVERQTPGFLPAMDENLPRNRLGFARWLLSPEHPLMSRVTVNRLWQQCFGVGLVKTSEDFGSQGEWPSHPELLDWLAVDFRESGWDVKRLMKQVVMSATYRQSSAVSAEQLRRDPENRLLSRAPRYRLDAEVLRDQALASSGLLVNELGGPGVKPPQPDGIWEAVGYTSSNTARFKADSGSAVYRRSVYTFWKRTAPPPAMNIMDAPSRESCQVRRERTNTPLQALLMLNEQQYFESARALARLAASTDDGGPRQVIETMYLRTLARPPRDHEVDVLTALFEDAQRRFENQPETAIEILGEAAGAHQSKADAEVRPDSKLVSAQAAWTIVANTVLNLDEVVTRN